MQQAVHFGAKSPLNRTLRRHFAHSGIEGSLARSFQRGCRADLAFDCFKSFFL